MADADARNPFVGPRPFRPSERLYGRQWETRQIIDLLIASRVVLLHAPSGAGKTSLLRTQVARACLQAGLGRPRFVRVGIEPPPALTGNRYVWSALLSLQSARTPVPDAAPADAGTLADRFNHWLDDRLARARRRVPEDERPDRLQTDVPRVLVFDQFEEILTHDQTDTAVKELFFDELARLLHNPRWWVVLAIRDDYLGALESFARRLPTRLRDRFRLDFLSEHAALEAIREPTAAVAVTFVEQAARRLVDELRLVSVQQVNQPPKKQVGPFVEPVHLQVVCRRLFAQRRQPDQIDEGDVEALASKTGEGQRFASGVDLALASYYRDALKRVSIETGLPERRVRAWIEQELISPGGLRRPVLKEGTSELEGGLPAGALTPLLNTYLVREEARHGATFIELAHDRLVEPIWQDNREWRERSLSTLQKRAVEWARKQRSDQLLLRGRALREARRWALEHEDELDPIERELLDASFDTDLRRSNLAETGWGIIFTHDADPAVREALGELLAHRHRQATRKGPRLYREFTGAAGYQPGETAENFVARHGASSWTVNAERLPYYLLIVGHPRDIPWEFQYELDVAYAVGRIWFDTPDDYAHYARGVVASEARDFSIAPRVSVFAPRPRLDTFVQLVGRQFVDPLVTRLEDNLGTWTIDKRLGATATREALSDLLFVRSSALLFTIGGAEGVGRTFAPDGGLVCADWPGMGALERSHLFTTDQVPTGASLLGSILMLLGNCTAGESSRNSPPGASPRMQDALVAPLARRFLSLPAGGALAVLGHVDRLWSTSFWFDGEYEYARYEKLIRQLLDGRTVGSAADLLGQRYSRLRVRLDEGLRDAYLGDRAVNKEHFRSLSKAMIDARNYVVIGDPAVRLRPAATASVARATPPIEPGSIEAGRRALAAMKAPKPAAAAADVADADIVGNGVLVASGRPALPRMTLEQLGGLLSESPAAGFSPADRDRLAKAYFEARGKRGQG